VEHYAGINVSLELSSVCIVDATGTIVKETKVESDPGALVSFFQGLGIPITRIGIEAGPLSQWLFAALMQAGFETVLLETRHVKAALSAMTVKTDRKDARGIAQLLRMGWFRPVHCKSPGSQEVRALLVARKLLLGKLRDVELSLRGVLRGFGLKMGHVTRKGFEERVRELCAGQAMLEQIADAMLSARASLHKEFDKLHTAMLAIVRTDVVCKQLMSVPGVGPVVAITFKTAIDDPTRIKKSKSVGALFGLTPRKYQSGETDVTGGITCVGDAMVREALYEAANSLLNVTHFSALKRWGWTWPNAAARNGRRSLWLARSASSCIACGSMERHSVGRRRRRWRRRSRPRDLIEQMDEIGAS
jgi:transposase